MDRKDTTTDPSKTFNEIMQKLDKIQRKYDSKSRSDVNLSADPKFQYNVLEELEKRYKIRTNNPTTSGSPKRSAYDDETPNSQSLKDIYQISDKLLKRSVEQNKDSKFLDDFFGVSSSAPDLTVSELSYMTKVIKPQNQQIQVKGNSLQQLKHIDSLNSMRKLTHFPNSSDLAFYHNEWNDFKIQAKLSFTSSFDKPTVWNQDQVNRNSGIKSIQEVFFSKIRQTNVKENISNLKQIFKTDSMSLSMGEKSYLNCVIELAQFLHVQKNVAVKRYSYDFEIKMIDFALKFMSNSFTEYMTLYANSSRSKGLGRIFGFTVPKSVELIQTIYKLSNINESSSFMLYGVPVWYLLYQLIRMQDYTTALTVITSLDPTYTILSKIVTKLSLNEPFGFSRDEVNDLSNLSKSKLSTTISPFEKLCLSLFTFSSIDLSSLKILETIEEFTWFKIMRIKLILLLNPTSFELPLSTLADELMHDFELEKPQNISNLFSQALCLLLVGSFEKSFDILSSDDIGLIFVIHSSILLWNTNTLRVTTNAANSYITDTTVDSYRRYDLNIVYLLNRFYFRIGHYTNQSSIFDYILHFNNTESCNIMPYIVDYYLKHNLVNTLLSSSISMYEYNRDNLLLFADYCLSINEYYLAVNIYIKLNYIHDNTLLCIIQILINIIITPEIYSSNVLREIQQFSVFLGDKILHGQDTNQFKYSSLFLLLLDFRIFLKYYHHREYEKALKVINTLNVIPRSVNDIPACLEFLRKYSNQLRFVYKHILVASVSSIKNSYIIKKNANPNITNIHIIAIKEQATALMSFFSQLPFHIPKSTHMQLIYDLSVIRK